MALDTVLLTRKALMAAALETTTGTAIVLDAADAGFIAQNGTIEPNVAYLPREYPGGSGNMKGQAAAKGGDGKFQMALYGADGSGSTAHLEALWQGCGLALAGSTFTPDITVGQTITLAKYSNGRRRMLAGAMGTMDWTISNSAPVTIDYSYMGIYQPVIDTADLAPTYDTTLPLVGANTLTFGGTSFVINEMKFSLGAQTQLRQDVTKFDASNRFLGWRGAVVTAITPTITIDPEAVMCATRDWYEYFQAGTDVAWNCVIGSAAGNLFTLTGTCNVTKGPTDGDRNGIATENIEMEVMSDTLSIVRG